MASHRKTVNSNLIGLHIVIRDEYSLSDMEDLAEPYITQEMIDRTRFIHSGHVIAVWADKNNHLWVTLNDGNSHNLQEHEVLKIDGVNQTSNS